LAIELSLYGAPANCRRSSAARAGTSLICRWRTGSQSHAMARSGSCAKRTRSVMSCAPA